MVIWSRIRIGNWLNDSKRNNYEKDIVYPALCLVVSGGHTELVLMKHPYSFEVIGETLDDAVGEAYDKVGRVLN